MKLEFATEKNFRMRDFTDIHGLLVGLFEEKTNVNLSTPKGVWMETLQTAFDILQSELDLKDDPRTVRVAFVGSFPGEGNTEGKTVREKTNPFKIAMLEEVPFKVLRNFAHEMVHVKDLAKGYLTAASEDKGAPIYRGKTVSKEIMQNGNSLAMVMIPQEREAYRIQDQLALKILKALPPNQLAFIRGTYAQSLPPPSVEGFYQSQSDHLTEVINALNSEFLKSKKAGDLPAYLAKFDNITDVT